MPFISGTHDGRKILLRAAVLSLRKPNDLNFLEVSALLDTGATGGAISPRIVEHFELKPHEKRYLKVATGDRLASYYFYRIGLFPDVQHGIDAPSSLPFVFAEIDGFGMQGASDFDMIIGMNVLQHCDFTMRRDGYWCLEFG